MQGSYIRVGDADKPMTEYEVYSYEAFRKKYRDDIRPVEQVRVQNLDQDRLAQYVLRRKQDRPHFATLELSRLYDLIGVTKNGVVTLAAVLLFSPYPQAYFPQLSIIGTHVPGTEMGLLDEQGRRFIDSKRLEGTLPEMLEQAVGVVRNNMQVSTRIDPATGRRIDRPEYPLDAVRETILNALVHRDYSIHTEGMPIRLTMYSDRLEVANPGGLYMLDCDKAIVDYVSALNGFYMRYSDDFCIIIPCEEKQIATDAFSHIKSILHGVKHLTLQPDKTQYFYYSGTSVENVATVFDSNSNGQNRYINFLGFTFDGTHIHIRGKTISKYYYRMGKKARSIVLQRKAGHNPSLRNLYMLYSRKGATSGRGNFLTYVNRAQCEFGVNEPIDQPVKNHMVKIRKRLNS